MNDDVDMPTSEQLAEVMAQIKPVGDVLVEVLSGLEIPAWQAIPALALVLGFYMSQKIHEHQEAYDMVDAILKTSMETVGVRSSTSH